MQQGKDALNLSKVKVKTFIMSQTFSTTFKLTKIVGEKKY